jgi:rubredoxin
MFYGAGNVKQECKICGYTYEQVQETEDTSEEVVQGDEPFLRVEGTVVSSFDTHWRSQTWCPTGEKVIACPRCGTMKVEIKQSKEDK